MSDTSRTFSKSLRMVAVPRLLAHDFKFDGSRTFRRFLPDGSVQIINFQLGMRSMSGQFTVNLAVYRADDHSDDPAFKLEKVMEYHCPMERRERLGMLLPRALAPLQRLPVLGFFFSPKDRWWQFSSDNDLTENSLRKAVLAIEQFGFPWLDQQ